MKNLKINLAIALAATLFAACKEDEKEPQEMNISMKVQLTNDGQAAAMNQDMTDDSGNTYQLTRFDMYLSEPAMKTNNGASTWIMNQHYLIQGSGTYDLGTVSMETPENWYELKMGIGVNADFNHEDPTTYSENNDLAPQSPSMHWNWNSGYRFVVIEGMVDVNGDATLDSTFAYHIGSDNLFRETSVVYNENVESQSSKVIELNVDIGQALSGINIATNLDTHTMNNMPLAQQIANNMTSALKK